jgi:anti-sigma-K factor RskA
MNNKEEHDQIFELIPEFALGILDANEAQFVRQHLEGCIACQQELASYESVVDALSLASPTIAPPANLKAQLFEQIGEPAASETVSAASWWQPVIDRAQTFLAGPRWQPALVLVVFAVLVGALYFWQQSNRLQPEQYELTATDMAPDAQGLIEAAARGQDATLNVSGLPVLPADKQYQLWLIVDGQRASGAVFSVAEDGTATVPIKAAQPLSEFGAFGITIEPAGGSPGPTGERVLGYNL